MNQAEQIEKAVRLLKKGEVIACATDTVYGLLADPQDASAIEKIFLLKGRSLAKPLQILVSDAKSARSLIEIPFQYHYLTKHWPGGLTVIGKRKLSTALGVGTKKTLGIRVPAGKTMQLLLRKYGASLAATSANPTGQPDAKSKADVKHYFGERIFVLTADSEVQTGRGSTVVDISLNRAKIIRQGALRIWL